MSPLVSADGSNRMRFLASRTFCTSRATSMDLKVGGNGGRSVSVGATMPGTEGLMLLASYWAPGSVSTVACSRSLYSASVRSSSDIGEGPSFKPPWELLKACGFVKLAVAPGVWGIREESKPVDSSHALGDTEVVFEALTAFVVSTFDTRR